MDVVLAPRIEKLVSLSSILVHQLKRSKQNEKVPGVVGRFYNGDRLAWLIDGSMLTMVYPSNGSIFSVYNFARISSSPEICITHVLELTDVPHSWKLLVVTTACGAKGTFLHFYNVQQTKVEKTIFVPEEVTSIEVISCSGGVNRTNVLLSQVLRYFYGIAAVGTASGSVILLDLGMDVDFEGQHTNQVNLLHSAIKVSYFTEKLNNLPQSREDLAAENKLLAYSLNDVCVKNKFYYVSPNNEVLLTFSAGDVYVSKMVYIKRIGCLVVGFNFGGFQIYDLTRLQLVYTCNCDEIIDQPVIEFAFQEPENDPKMFCYVWVIRGGTQSEVMTDQFCYATLYSVLFYNKTLMDGIGTCYLGVKECSKRLSFPLHGCTKSADIGNWTSSRLIACSSIDSRSARRDLAMSDGVTLRDEGCGNICCCVFVWEAFSHQKKKNSEVNLGIFDLNQWYQAQMPSTLIMSNYDLCSYFGLFSLNAFCDLGTMNSLLDVHFVPQSVSRPAIGNHIDSMFYPSALSFDVLLLTEACVVYGSFLGLHRQVLHEIRVNAAQALVDPRRIISMCVFCGLISPSSATHTSQMTVSYKREAIFNMALECGAFEIIMSCIVGWSSGQYHAEDCTLRFIQDWTWKKVLKIKTFLDKQCTFLYDHSGLQFDRIIGQSIRHNVVMLKDLEIIVKSLLKQTHLIPTTNLGAKELEHRASVISLLMLHFDVVLWFINARLLPEAPEDDDSESIGFPFPKTFLNRIYGNRRSEIQRINSSLKPTDVLIIDGIEAEECSVPIWRDETGCYPPNSINSLLNILLLPELSLPIKHTIVQYFLLDLAEIMQNGSYAHLCEPLSEYCNSFACSQSVILLTKGFWLLDHKDFEGAINVLLHPMINMLDIRPWHSRRIMKAFLYQGEPEKALRYAHAYHPCKENAEDIQFHLSLLLANGLVSDAFSYYRAVRDQTNLEELIQHFFLGCQQTKNLRKLLQLLFSPFEEQSLIKFMTNNSDPKVRELLVIYHLQRSHFIDALQLNDQLNSDVMHITDPCAKERAATRNAIIEGYSKVYPKIQMDLAKLTRTAINQRKMFWETGNKVPPAPLSTVVVNNPVQPMSKSTVLEAIMEKITEMWAQTSPIPPSHSFVESETDQPKFVLTQTPFTPRRNIPKISHNTVINPTKKRKDTIELHFGESFLASSPIKSKYLESSPFCSSESTKRRTESKVYSSELLSLLQPVPVKHFQRHSSSIASSCPASILKQRAVRQTASNLLSTNGRTTELSASPVLSTDVDMENRDYGRNRTPILKSTSCSDDMKLMAKIRFSSQNSKSDSSLELSPGGTPSPRRPIHISDKSSLSRSPLERKSDILKTSSQQEADNSSESEIEVEEDDESETGDDDDSLYLTPEKMGNSAESQERSITPKSYFNPASFRERITWLKTELAKEKVKDSDEITITSSLITDKTEIKIVGAPQKSLVEQTVDMCFANDDDDSEMMKRYKNRRTKAESVTSVSDEDVEMVQPSLTAGLDSVGQMQAGDLMVEVEFPGITKASLRSYSPKSSPTLSQGSKSDKESLASEGGNLVPSSAAEEKQEPAATESQKSTSKISSRLSTMSARKTKKPETKYVFSPPTVVETELADLTATDTLLSPTSAAFIFSTPLTRSKLKKVRKTLSSAKTGATSLLKMDPPTPTTQPSRTRRSSRSEERSSETLISFVSPALEVVDEEESSTTVRSKLRHSMTLRKSAMKAKRKYK